eukprot:557528-Rhodomonas_salina.2
MSLISQCCIYAVMGVNLFRDRDPLLFGSFARALFTMFQVPKTAAKSKEYTSLFLERTTQSCEYQLMICFSEDEIKDFSRALCTGSAAFVFDFGGHVTSGMGSRAQISTLDGWSIASRNMFQSDDLDPGTKTA